MRLSNRSNIDSFIVMDVMEAATRAEAAGRHIIHMEVGQPGTPAPAKARKALADAMEQGALGYTVALGLPELRTKIADRYATHHGVDISPERVIITAGASGAFILAFSALFDAGDRVALGAPGYPSYRQILTALSLTPVDIETRMQDRYQPVPGDLPDDIRGLIVASPANPSGTMLDRSSLSALIEAAHARGAAFVSDEIYHGLQYERDAVSALEISDDTYVVNSFSKYFSMTGWRVGWMVLPEKLVRPIERIAQSLYISAPALSQAAAIHAFEATMVLDAVKARYAQNRAHLLEALPALGFDIAAPMDGAFYAYCDVSRRTNDSMEFARRMIQEAHVAATPGHDFDPTQGERFMRFSYAGRVEDMVEATDRLKRWLSA